jgi:hypothetical protein
MNNPDISVQKVFYALALITIVVASFQPSVERIIWTLFGVAFLVAADKIKDVEKAKRKEREQTEIRMIRAQVDEDKAGSDATYAFLREQIALAHERSLNQVSTYVKDASPTRKR